MATSGTTSYSRSRDQIIKAALRALGVIASGEAPNADEVEDAAEALNLMVKTWQASGLHLWQETAGSLTLAAGTQSYTMGGGGDFSARPLKIIEGRRRESGIDTPMRQIGRMDYQSLPYKANTGAPTQFWYDPGRTQGRLYVWPANDSTARTFQFSYRRSLEDLTSAPNDFDCPAEWLEALKWNLAIRLAPEYGRPVSQEIAALAEQALDVLHGFDREEASVSFAPDHRWG